MFWFDLYGQALELLQVESIFTLMARITYQGTQRLGAHGCSGANIPGKTISGLPGISDISGMNIAPHYTMQLWPCNILTHL